jgi:hypothetical protein
MIDKVNLAERYMFLDATIHVAKNGASSLGFATGKTEIPSLETFEMPSLQVSLIGIMF